MDWQAIKTAPKDTKLLVTDGKTIAIAALASMEVESITGPETISVWITLAPETKHQGLPLGHIYYQPTHWMPLPNLPV